MFNAKSVDPHQTPQSVASNLGLHCFQCPFYGMQSINGLIENNVFLGFLFTFFFLIQKCKPLPIYAEPIHPMNLLFEIQFWLIVKKKKRKGNIQLQDNTYACKNVLRSTTSSLKISGLFMLLSFHVQLPTHIMHVLKLQS